MVTVADATGLAERATLGSLLLDPAPLPRLRAWLRAGDFAEPVHARVYAVLCERHAAGHDVDPMLVATALGATARPHQPVVLVHQLIGAAPTTPHAVAYARLVAEAGMRREVAGLGVLLQAGALQSALATESGPMTATCTLVDAGLQSVASRWDAATSSTRSSPLSAGVPVPVRAALRNPDLRLGADKLLQAHPPRDHAVEREHEALLVGALLTHPRQVHRVAALLRPERISSPAWRTVYAATVELAELGRDVDLVTVAAAVARLAHHGVPAPSLAEVSAACDQARFMVPRLVERDVWVDQMRRIADHGAHQLQVGAANPGVYVTDLVDTGHLITSALRDAARMLPEYAVDERPRPLTVDVLEPTRRPATR